MTNTELTLDQLTAIAGGGIFKRILLKTIRPWEDPSKTNGDLGDYSKETGFYNPPGKDTSDGDPTAHF